MGKNTEQWTLGADKIPANLRLHQPLYILTSEETFSGGEAFAFHLRNLNRCTLVGETTGGASNMVTPMQMVVESESGHEVGTYEILMPYIKGLSPQGDDTNWGAQGVVPDITVTADDAWEEAYELILTKG